jgi:protein NrfC
MAEFVKTDYSRRDFLTGLGGVGLGAVFGGVLGGNLFKPDRAIAIPASQGYIVVDTMRCSGCTTCMLTCSLVHHGEQSLSLSRIQVETDPFAAFPGGIVQEQCRQCPFPACVEACPTGALHVDAEHGNVRTVDKAKCIGCERCINACPFTPARVLWNNEEKHAQKCDLCADTPYWKEKGGPGGKQVCVESCPMKAISFTHDVPAQAGVSGYQINLRKTGAWGTLGYPTGDNGQFTQASTILSALSGG